MAYVYQLRIEGEQLPFYIGAGSGKRARSHLSPCHHRDNHPRSVVIRDALAVGKRVLVEILHDDLAKAAALEIEESLIATYGRADRGAGCLTNLSDGGLGSRGHVMPEERRRRLSEQAKSRRWSPEQRAKLSASIRGRKLPPAVCSNIAAAKMGAKNPAAKLCERDVLDIYSRLKAGERRGQIAERYGVHVGQVDRIRMGKKWRHLHHHFTGG